MGNDLVRAAVLYGLIELATQWGKHRRRDLVRHPYEKFRHFGRESIACLDLITA